MLASLNPAKAICDMFYSLYYYDGLEVFAGNVALIGLFSAALFAVGAVREEAALCKPVDMPWKWWRSIPSICWCTWLLSLMGLFITSGVYPPATSAGYESARCPSR